MGRPTERQQQPRCREREKYARIGPYYLTPPCAAPLSQTAYRVSWRVRAGEAAALRCLAAEAAAAPIHPPGKTASPAPVGPPRIGLAGPGGGAPRPPGWMADGAGTWTGTLLKKGGRGNANLRFRGRLRSRTRWLEGGPARSCHAVRVARERPSDGC